MIKAVISGDIVAYTSLNDAGRELIENALKELINELNKNFNTYSRIIKGDYLECVVPNPENALVVALAIKSFVKSIPIKDLSLYKTNNKIKLFKTYGIRLAIGYGTLSRYDSKKGIIDGEAIYLSGRTINKFSTYNKKRIVIKNTMYFVSNNLSLNETFEPIIALLDVLINKATSKQCKVLYLKLMNNNEDTIAKKLGIKQSVVNQHSKSIGWNAIDKTLKYFNEVIKKQ
ncbi:MAG: RNA polymerase subunit sigma-70 [Bacteroidales bacterium]|nr:RNA polymerase subunit sigma-70 [Bacteroidales bacterium]